MSDDVGQQLRRFRAFMDRPPSKGVIMQETPSETSPKEPSPNWTPMPWLIGGFLVSVALGIAVLFYAPIDGRMWPVHAFIWLTVAVSPIAYLGFGMVRIVSALLGWLIGLLAFELTRSLGQFVWRAVSIVAVGIAVSGLLTAPANAQTPQQMVGSIPITFPIPAGQCKIGDRAKNEAEILRTKHDW